MALLDFESKRSSAQREAARLRRAQLEEICAFFRLFAFAGVSLAVSAALTVAFVVPLLYTHAQYAQIELQDDVDFCLQRTATLSIRVDMLEDSSTHRIKRQLQEKERRRRKTKKPTAADYAEVDAPPGISPTKSLSKSRPTDAEDAGGYANERRVHGAQTHGGGYELDPSMESYTDASFYQSGYGGTSGGASGGYSPHSSYGHHEQCCSCGIGRIGEPGAPGLRESPA
ncbi:hypothetical protein M3Y99_01543700 [Aphelenchoides fujianensis]|nr:hypothetical protein M3Y99_01543700 [Aphelenchoides fujianensis]